MRISSLLTLAATCLTVSANHAAEVLLHDQMDNTDRATQNLPTEAAWYKGGGSNVTLNPTVTGMEFTRADAGTSRLLASHYVNAASGYTLAIGETLKMAYTFSPSTVPSGNAYNTDNRMSILSYANHPELVYTADNSSANGPTVTDLSGYMFTFHISDALASTPLQLYKINPSATGSFSSSSSFSSLAGQVTDVSATGGMTSGETYSLQLDVARTSGSQVDLTLSYLDSSNNVIASISATDATDPAITFDGFAYRASTQANFGATQTITDFSVEIIPEPSVYALLLGVGVLGFVLVRRRVV